MPNMIEAKIVHNQRIPVGLLKLSRQMTGHVVVDLSEILQEKKTRYLALKCSTTMPCRASAASLSASSCRTSNARIYECVPTDRNEEAACAFTAPEEVPREQLQPCVVSIEYHMFILLLTPATELCKPRVLRGERGGGIALSEVEDEIEEGWDGASRKGLDARHGDRGRSCVRGEWNGSAITDQTIHQSDRSSRLTPCMDAPLNKSHGAALSEHEIAPQGIDDHEYDLVERRMCFRADPFLSIVTILPICKTGQYRFIGKEASCKYQDCNREEEVRKSKTGHALTARRNHAS